MKKEEVRNEIRDMRSKFNDAVFSRRHSSGDWTLSPVLLMFEDLMSRLFDFYSIYLDEEGTQKKTNLALGEALISECILKIHNELFESLKMCKSPIEQLVMMQLFAQKQRGLLLDFKSQHAVGYYHVDFAVWATTTPLDQLIAAAIDRTRRRMLKLSAKGLIVKYAIECDGHDFHEKTPEQAARDKKRDNFIQSQGWKVFRFTGREIWHDAKRVADEALKMAVGKNHSGFPAFTFAAGKLEFQKEYASK